tara:strand:- start:888 stop:1415 length:528 start_codon:yes stop_codon:yes gene_type:complete
MSALATANSGVLTTDASGVPSIDTTNFVRQTTGMQVKGNNTNTAPPSGFIGQQIVSTVASGSAVSLSGTVTATSITSISLTAGIWDVSCLGCFNLNGSSVVSAQISINSSVANGTAGNNNCSIFLGAAGLYDGMASIPSYRVTLSGTTTYFLVMWASYTVANPKGYGRLSATRVG